MPNENDIVAEVREREMKKSIDIMVNCYGGPYFMWMGTNVEYADLICSRINSPSASEAVEKERERILGILEDVIKKELPDGGELDMWWKGYRNGGMEVYKKLKRLITESDNKGVK